MLSVRNLEYEVDGHEVFSEVSFDVNERDKIGLVGANGVGKTSLLRIVSGIVPPTSGEILAGDIEVGLLPQDIKEWMEYTVYGFLEDVTGVGEAKTELERVSHALGEDSSPAMMEIFQVAFDRAEHLDIYGFEARVEKALKSTGIAGVDVDKEVGDLSGGQKTRLAMAAIFAAKFDIILLDEPTNNLDTEGVELLERFINRSSSAFLMVSHDRRFLRNSTTRIFEMLGADRGIRQYGLGYDEYIEARGNSQEAVARRFEEYEREKKRLRTAISAARVAANSAERGRPSSDNDKLTRNFRSQKASGNLAGKVGSLMTRLESLEPPEEPFKDVDLSFVFGESESTSQRLVTVEGATVTYPTPDGGEIVLGPFSLDIGAAEKVAITGPNGIGKSTLLRSIIDPTTVSGGKVNLGPSIRVGYIDQNQTLPIPDQPAVENLLQLSPGLSREDAMHILRRFNMSRDTIQQTPGSRLSGGQRAKVLLATIAANKANLLILDEPTNNLDVPTIEGLEQALKTYKGSILVVSHDREFIDNIGVNREVKLS